MTVISQRSTLVDLVRAVLVAAAAVGQTVVAAVGGSAAVAMAQASPTPVLAAGWTFAIMVPILLGFLAHAAYQLFPAQRPRQVHRRTGWWLAVAALANTGWLAAFGGGALPVAALLMMVSLGCLAVAFGRLSHVPADGPLERVLLRGVVGFATGWASFAVVVGTAASGVWIGLPGEGALAAIAAIVVLLAVSGIVAWAVLSGTAVVAFAVAAVWALCGIALGTVPDGVVVTCGAAAVLVIVAVARRLGGSGFPARAAWG